MLFSTPSQFAVLALVLVAGWFLGLASASGGRKWRERYTAERDAHAAYRKDADARVVDARREAEARAAEADRRRADSEREHARLAAAAPVTAATVTPASTVAPVASATTAARPAYPADRPLAADTVRPVYPDDARRKRGWFDWR